VILFGDANYLQKVALVVFKGTMMTWYVVYQGKKPGVYDSWPLCCAAVARYSNNCYKGFKRKEVVASFLEYTGSEDFSMEENAVNTPCITVGGNQTRPKSNPLFAIALFLAVLVISLGVFISTRCCKCI